MTLFHSFFFVVVVERIAVENCYPAISRGNRWRNVNLSQFGNTHGLDLQRAILKEKVKLGGRNEILVHRNIAIHDSEDDRLLIQLPEEVITFDTRFSIKLLIL